MFVFKLVEFFVEFFWIFLKKRKHGGVKVDKRGNYQGAVASKMHNVNIFTHFEIREKKKTNEK